MVKPIRPLLADDAPQHRGARLSFRPTRDEPEHLATHYFNTAADAMAAVEAAETLDLGVRLRNEQSEVSEDTLTLNWLVEIWTEPAWGDEDESAFDAGC